MCILRACMLFMVLGLMILFPMTDRAEAKDRIKIGTISIQQILSGSEAGLHAKQELEDKAGKFREKFEAEQKKMDALRLDLQKGAL